MNGDRGNGNTILLTVIGVATLLVALVGATFAYFSATASINEQSLSVTTANPVGLIYLGSELSITEALPGDSDSGEFTIENPYDSNIAQQYSLKLHIDENTFTRYHQAVDSDPNDQGDDDYALSQLTLNIGAYSSMGTTINLESESIDLTDGGNEAAVGMEFYIVTDQMIDVEDTHTYSLDLAFSDTGNNQDENKGATFGAHIIIYDTAPISQNQP